jgi:hypothetical protein
VKGKYRHFLLVRSLAAVFFMLLCLFLCSCGLYDIDAALMAPYGLSMTLGNLIFYGDDEALLEGYNLWYKESSGVFYTRCEYEGMLPTPTIAKTGEATSLYTVDIGLLSPQDSKDSFKDLGISYYFAVSAYGTGMAESGKAEFGLWPYGAQ